MVGYTSSPSRSQSAPCESPYQQTPKMAGPKPRQSRDAAAMSKTTTIKITTRIITTHLPCLDTTIAIKSQPHFFGEASVYFDVLMGDEVTHRERVGSATEQQQNRRSLTPANGVDARPRPGPDAPTPTSVSTLSSPPSA